MSRDCLAVDGDVDELRDGQKLARGDLFAAKMEQEVDGEEHESRVGGKRKDSPVEIELAPRTKRRGSKEKAGLEVPGRETRRSRRLTVGKK